MPGLFQKFKLSNHFDIFEVQSINFGKYFKKVRLKHASIVLALLTNTINKIKVFQKSVLFYKQLLTCFYFLVDLIFIALLFFQYLKYSYKDNFLIFFVNQFS